MIRLDRSDRLDQVDPIDPKRGGTIFQKWQKSTIFGPIWTKFRSKQLKIWPGIHFYIDPIDRIDPIESIRSDRSDRVDPIESIRSNRLQKWIPGQILSCLDLNFVQIGPFL